MLHILEVKPLMKKAAEYQEDVIIKAYDEDHKIHEFTGKKSHITPSREVVPDKHNYTPQTLLEELRKAFPGMHFETKPYGKKKSVEELPEDIKLYIPTESFIVHHIGPRHEKKKLEFYLDEEKTKPLFITKLEKQHMARSYAIPSKDPNLDERLEGGYEYFQGLTGIVPWEDITINKNLRCIQLNVTRNQLAEISKAEQGQYLRIKKHKSEEFSEEEQAKELYERLKKIPGIKENTDQLRIGERITKERKKAFFVQALTNNAYKGLLEEYGLKQKEGPDRIDTVKNDPDLLGLNSSTQQLRNFFPAHLPFNPEKSLEEQANTEIHPYKEGIEGIVSRAEQFYLENTCAIDIETIHFEDDDPLEEEINMAVLKSLSEHKVYVTRKYLKEKFGLGSLEKKKWKGADLIQVEDDIELRAAISRDAAKYEYVAGHFFKGFDHEKLKKYNEENKLLREGKISKEKHERIKSVKKEYKAEKLWDVKQNALFDTYHFIRSRSGLQLDHKLATFSGTDKMGHEELNEKALSGKAEDLHEVLSYTAMDGHISWKVLKELLPYAVTESLATNKPLNSVFSSNPVDNFYHSVSRGYFMKMNTYAFRHDRSFKILTERLRERLSPEELLGLQVKGKRQIIGEYNSSLFYPSAMVGSFREIIDANPVTRFLHERVESEKNPLAKDIGLSQLSASIHVAADKVKNYIENAGLVFGKKYEPHEIYKSMNEDTMEAVKNKFNEEPLEEEEGFSDLEMSRTSYIFSREYNVERKAFRHAGISFDTTMLHFNNLFAENLKVFEMKGFLGKSGKYYVSNKGLGYSFGEVRVLNMPKNRMLASLKADNGTDYAIYANFKPAKSTLLREMANDWVSGSYKGLEAYKADSRFSEESSRDSFKGFIKAVNKKL